MFGFYRNNHISFNSKLHKFDYFLLKLNFLCISLFELSKVSTHTAKDIAYNICGTTYTSAQGTCSTHPLQEETATLFFLSYLFCSSYFILAHATRQFIFFISAFLPSLWVPLEAEMLSWTLFRSLKIYCSSNSTSSSLISSFVYFKFSEYNAEWFCN